MDSFITYFLNRIIFHDVLIDCLVLYIVVKFNGFTS